MSRPDDIYAVNMKRLALLLLPTFWRKPLIGGLIYAGVSALGRQLGELREYRKETGYRLEHSGQACKLRGVLNDEFDPELRRIRVEDSESAAMSETSRIWKREKERWAIVPARGRGALTIHREGYAGTSGYDFWLTVPAELRSAETETRLRAMTDIYKLASKRYAINYQ